jgi:hypothetical protein
MFGGFMVWDLNGNAATQEPQYMQPIGAITATAYIWNGTGTPTTGIDASLMVSGTTYGSLAACDLINWDSTFDGWGINIITNVDGANLVTSGPFNTPYDNADWAYWLDQGYIFWDDFALMGGVNIVGGKLTIPITGADVAPIDLISQVYVVPGGMGTFNGDTLAYNIRGNTTIGGDYVIGRSYTVAGATLNIAKPILTALTTGFDASVATVTATDANNLPIVGASAKVYQNSLRGNLDYMIVPYGSGKWTSISVATDVDGVGSETLVAVAKNNVVTQASIRADVFATASVSGAISLLAQNQVVIHVAQAFAALVPIEETQMIGDKISVTAIVTNSQGVAIPNLPVELTASGGVNVSQPAMASDANGQVTFELDTSGMTDVRAAFVPVQAKCGGIAWEVGLATMSIPVMNEGPSIAILSPASGGDVVKKGVVMTGSVSDSNGVQTVKVSVDGGAVTTVTGTAGTTVWDLKQLLGDLAKGNHSVKVTATDSLGISSEATVSFNAINQAGGTDWLAWGLAIAGFALAGVVALMWMMRRPKRPEDAMATPEPEPAKPEEPKL